MFTEITLENLRNVRIACAVALIVGFFMPWVSIWGMGIAGYKIPEMAQGLRGLGSAMGMQEDPRFILFLLPYLIPILAFVIIIKLLGQPIGTKMDGVGIVAGIIPFLGLFYGLSQIGGDLFRVLAIGGYWTLLAGAILTAASLDFDTIVHYQLAMFPGTSSQVFKERSPLPAGNSEFTSNYNCPTCGASQSSDVVTCGDCGAMNLYAKTAKEQPGSEILDTQPKAANPIAARDVSKKQFCSQCGERIDQLDNFCAQCGNRV